MKLQSKITRIFAMIMTVLIVLLTGLSYGIWYNAMQKQVALDAMDQAIIIAENQVVKDQITLDNGYITISKALENIQLKTKIHYLYVIDQTGRYFSHPLPSKINTMFDVQDLKRDPRLQKPQYYYEMTGEAKVEGYAPVFSEGVYSGAVVVGIYNGRILQTLKTHLIMIVLFAFFAIGIGIWIAYALARSIKRDIFNLEPEEIAILLNQRELILENIGEGILVTDRQGQILLINENANRLMGATQLRVNDDLTDHPIKSYFNTMRARQLDYYEVEWRITPQIILKVSISALNTVDERLGYLCRLDDMSLVRKRAEELTNMVQLTQALRAQNHEFMNKLHTISGLIQLDETDKALSFIEQTSKSQQEIIGALSSNIKIPTLSGLILSKYSKAAERKIKLTIHSASYVSALPVSALDDDITSIIGNLIDNAIDALSGVETPEIILRMLSNETEFSIEVKDNGAGMDPEWMSLCIERGFSTKGRDRGFGLAIVSEKVAMLGGTLVFENENGLRCLIVLPMTFEGGKK